MIATVRCIKASDFLLVFGSVAVLVLSCWPPSLNRQRVQLRQADGTVREFSIPENDPTIAKLRLAMERWGKAGQETRLAVAKWRAELADFYISRTEPASPASALSPSTLPPSTSALSPPSSQTDAAATDGRMQMASFRRLEGLNGGDDSQARIEFWRGLGQRARDSIAEVEEIRRSRRALEAPQPIVFGPLQPGNLPWPAFLVALFSGLLAASLFTLWSYWAPEIRLYSSANRDEPLPAAEVEASAGEIRLVVPASWVRVHQPIAVLVRSLAQWALVISACLSLFN